MYQYLSSEYIRYYLSANVDEPVIAYIYLQLILAVI